MALPSSGSISMSQIRSELGKSGAFSLSDSDGLVLSKQCSGSVSMSGFRGAPAGIPYMYWGTSNGPDYRISNPTKSSTSSGIVYYPQASEHSNSFTVAVATSTFGQRDMSAPSGWTLLGSNGGPTSDSSSRTVKIFYRAGKLPDSETWTNLPFHTMITTYGFRTSSGKAISSVQAHGPKTEQFNAASNGSTTFNLESNCNASTGKSWLYFLWANNVRSFNSTTGVGNTYISRNAGGQTSGYTRGYSNFQAGGLSYPQIWIGNGDHCDALRNNVPTEVTIDSQPNRNLICCVAAGWFGLS